MSHLELFSRDGKFLLGPSREVRVEYTAPMDKLSDQRRPMPIR